MVDLNEILDSRYDKNGDTAALGAMVILMTGAGTLFSFILMLTGGMQRSSWTLMLAIYFAGQAYVKSSFFPLDKQTRRSRKRMIMKYGQYRMAGIAELVLLGAVLLFVIIKRDVYQYSAVSICCVICYTLLKLVYYFWNAETYLNFGKFMTGFRWAEYGEILMLMLLLIHAVCMRITGNDSVFPWFLGLAGFGALFAGSVYMIWFAGERIQYYRRRR